MTHLHPPTDRQEASRTSRAWLVPSAVTAVAAVALALTAPHAAQAAVSPSASVVINEVYGGGGNSGATYKNDFVELVNVSGSPVSLAGWSLQYASATGTSYTVQALSGTIAAGGSFLVQEAAGAGGTTDLPSPDLVPASALSISGTTGKLALVNATTALSGAGGNANGAASVVDFVGWGPTASDYAGTTGPAPVASNTTSVSRDASHANTADNSKDFAAGAPTPVGSGGSGGGGGGGSTPVSISEIQGTGSASTYVGKTVTTRGVVTASYPTGGLNGFVIQTSGTGGAIDLATHTASDAIFVYSPSVAIPARNSFVDVTGVVSEFNGLTELTASSTANVADQNPVLPVPATVSWPAADAQRESLESMLVAPQGRFTVSNTYSTNQYGEVGLAAGDHPLMQPTDVARPGTPEAAAVVADNAARGVTLDDGASTNFLSTANTGLTPPYVSLSEPVRVGASVTFTDPVIVDWRNSTWKFNTTAPVVGDGTGNDGVVFQNTRTAAPAAVGGAVSVASFNVLNYFTTLGVDNASCQPYVDRTGDGDTVKGGCLQRGAWDSQDFARQQAKIVAAINGLDSSVVGLMEVENSVALGEPADEALSHLVTALNTAAGSAKWAYVPSSTELPPVAEQDVITTAIIYQPALVTRIGPSRALGTQSADGEAFQNARPPIAQVFRPAAGGESFLFAVNHFKSKGSAGPWPGDQDTGDGQGASNESRVHQAEALRDWIASIRGQIDTVAMAGDYNSYSSEDPLQVLYDAGYADAEHALGLDESSYSFDGLSGSLDHVLLSSHAVARATGGDIWNINSGESVALEYSRYNYHGTLFYAPDAYRSSDHDPVKVGLAAGVDDRTHTTTALTVTAKKKVNKSNPALLTASVAASSSVAGTVEFREGSTLIGSATLSGGSATFTIANLAKGDHTFTATFVPADPDAVLGSTSTPVTVRTN